MKKAKLRKKVESLRSQIKNHKEKIERERQKSFPDEGCISHWEKEIISFENQIEKAIRKLGE
jgi:peptidoglycan hydrolase CwlO-like protein